MEGKGRNVRDQRMNKWHSVRASPTPTPLFQMNNTLLSPRQNIMYFIVGCNKTGVRSLRIPFIQQLTYQVAETMQSDEPIQLSNRERLRSIVKNTINFTSIASSPSDLSPLSPTKTEISTTLDPRSFENFYFILNKLGEGTSGVVKKCKEIKSGDIYAVKVSSLRDQELIRITKRTYQIMKRIYHPNVIRPKCLFINENTSKTMLVMEYCSYPSLKKLLQTQDLNEAQCKLIIKQLLLGVSAIHKMGVCHRDIKPDNILFSLQTNCLKIIDFGISKFIYNRKTIAKEKMWTVTGSIYYKAPEMFSGTEYDEGVDAWAIGITAFQLLYKRLPFYSQEQINIIEQIEKQEPDYNNLNIKESTLAIDFIKSLLKKCPDQRSSVEQALCHPWIESGNNFNKSGFTLKEDRSLYKCLKLTQSSNSGDLTNQQNKRYTSFSPESDIVEIQRQFRVFGNIRSSSVQPQEIEKGEKKTEKKAEKKFSFQLQAADEQPVRQKKMSSQI